MEKSNRIWGELMANWKLNHLNTEKDDSALSSGHKCKKGMREKADQDEQKSSYQKHLGVLLEHSEIFLVIKANSCRH